MIVFATSLIGCVQTKRIDLPPVPQLKGNCEEDIKDLAKWIIKVKTYYGR